MFAITIDRIKFFDDVVSYFLKKVLRRNKILELAGGSFDLPGSGLWTQHASTAPSYSDAAFTR